MTEQQAKDWLKRQAIWQIYLPAPRRVPRPKFDVAVPNEVHQADLLFLPHDHIGRKTFRYALTFVDVASRYKEAEPLATKEAKEVTDDLSRIYRQGSLKWPKLLQVDFLGICDGETLARVDCDGIAKSPVLAPPAVEDLAGIFQGHLDDVLQDELLQVWPAIQQGPGDGDHDVLPPSVFGAV